VNRVPVVRRGYDVDIQMTGEASRHGALDLCDRYEHDLKGGAIVRFLFIIYIIYVRGTRTKVEGGVRGAVQVAPPKASEDHQIPPPTIIPSL
jgi:hypothetical protein